MALLAARECDWAPPFEATSLRAFVNELGVQDPARFQVPWGLTTDGALLAFKRHHYELGVQDPARFWDPLCFSAVVHCRPSSVAAAWC